MARRLLLLSLNDTRARLTRQNARYQSSQHRSERIRRIKEQIMKRFFLLAALVGGMTWLGTSSTAKADHFVGPGWRGYGRPHGYAWRGYGPRYYGYRPFVTPGLVIGGPRFSVGIGTAYPYPAYPVYGSGCAYPGYYGW